MLAGGVITFEAGSGTGASTSFVDGTWQTSVPACVHSTVFISGILYNVTSDITAGSAATVPSEGVPWTATFASPDNTVSFAWQWGVAVYTQCTGTPDSLDVKPIAENGFPTGAPTTLLTPMPYLASGGTGSGERLPASVVRLSPQACMHRHVACDV